MFHHLANSHSAESILQNFCAPVRSWWQQTFPTMTPPQLLAVPAIQSRQHTLVCAPTGSGKTLSAFIAILSDLFSSPPAQGISCIYISPLRALGADITRNLLTPLNQISALANIPENTIRAALRTGDTTSAQRKKILTHPPHILVTTPETLALSLAQSPMRTLLKNVRSIIVDELHALAPNKRGVDLALSLERLSTLVRDAGHPDPLRIGLSATIAPLESIAAYLVGPNRTCAIADASFNRPMTLDIHAPFGKTPFARGNAISKNVYDHLEHLIRAHRTTLVFTNTRAATERVVYQMRKRFAGADSLAERLAGSAAIEPTAHADLSADSIEAHHSSLDRDMRLDVEDRLKRGVLRCVVCSTSLELGIDIGSIDRVVLLNSPKGVARGLQRVGRSGHSHGEISRGTFIPTVPADLIESVVTAEMMRRRNLDQIRIPTNCLDVLSQHLIGMTVGESESGLDLDAAFATIRNTHTYATLARENFDACVAYLLAADTTPAAAKLILQNGRLFPSRKSIAALYWQNAGTIASEGTVRIKLDSGPVIGTVEEAFAQILKPDDRFILAGRCVRFTHASGMTVYVTPSDGQQPTIPRWFSGQLSMEPGLATHMRDFRAKVRAIAPAGESAIARMLARQYRVDTAVATLCAKYLHVQHAYADIPVDGELLVERVPDENSVALVFHTMIGRAANEALARLVAFRMHQRFGTNSNDGGGAAVVIDDYAFGVWVTATTAARRADRALIRSLLSPDNFHADLLAAIEASELFKSQFRYTAVRAHAILQNRFGQRRFIGQLQGAATRLHEALQQTAPDHLLIRETRRTVLHDLLDSPAALTYLTQLTSHSLRILDLPSPSPFSFGLFATGRRDSLQLADTSDFLLAMYEQIQRRMAKEKQSPPAEALLF